MPSKTILTVTKDAEWLIGMRPHLHATARGRLIVADSVDEAGGLLEYACPRLVVIHWGGETRDLEALAALLWKNSTQPRPAPVMIVAEDYDVEEATLLFRLGVDEYIGKAEHGKDLPNILGTLSPERGRKASAGFWGKRDAGDLDPRFETVAAVI